ncbi:MAG: bifunctional DNA-formamidopyrimidine glycosylase/DNA-(apurinic or apyrimidinic site) lyase [bacterium]|nr:bifunctional DNA-formamidopyrimidine glycosylase/DNA-(apurinic or apyrimidinic site) lyase [bacterium]
MPELPEVETIKRYLQKAIVGKTIIGVEVLSEKQFPDNPKQVIGQKILAVDRRAKVLIIRLSNKKSLLVHLKLSGQLIWAKKAGEKAVFRNEIPFAGKELPAKTTRVIISLSGGKLFFNEMRKFGWIRISNEDQLNSELKRYGPEPFAKDFSTEYLQSIFQKSSKPIKTVLLDQEKIAGIGNIYANEALFKAKINPARPVKGLTVDEIQKLRQAILLVLKQGIKYGGASDVFNVKPDGSKGRYQEHFLVYRQNGQKCPKCGTTIKRVNLGGRGTFFCPKCQV